MSAFRQPAMRPAPPGESAPRRRAAGLTLIELMVSVVILAIMILIVSSLLANSRDAIEKAQINIRANGDARAVATQLRTDLASVSKEGFLCIAADDGSGTLYGYNIMGSHCLCFTTVSPYRSKWLGDTTIANAARIDYGVMRVQPFPAQPTYTNGSQVPVKEKALFRRAMLMSNGTLGRNPNDWYYDYEPIPLAVQGPWPPSLINKSLSGALFANYQYPKTGGKTYAGIFYPPGHPSSLAVLAPAGTLDQVRALWPYMVGNCLDMKVEWADGTLTDASGQLAWYGVKNPKDTFYKDSPSGAEFSLDAAYTALWTSKNKSNWPTALRITFALVDDAHTYQVIADLPR